MIRCRNCSHEEIEGSLFCSDCGARLLSEDRHISGATQIVSPLSTRENSDPPIALAEDVHHAAIPFPESPASFTLQVMDLGEIIALEGKEEFTLGRATEGQPLIPEIDLNAYNAYEQGVSRMHAMISIRGDRITITDLGSANGTWVNGDRVSPHTARVLNHGDLVTLGKFRLQALLKS
ncbi:MAG TPA: FHA domain-containing protein [Anaerolineales bacterium]|nr:FHA domain-containing protein [Anaerolineales bacterium]